MQFITDFIDYLRKINFEITPAQTLDTLQAVEIIGIKDKQILKSALKSILVTEITQVEKFENSFDLFFSTTGQLLKNVQKEALQSANFTREEIFQLNNLLEEFSQINKENKLTFLFLIVFNEDKLNYTANKILDIILATNNIFGSGKEFSSFQILRELGWGNFARDNIELAQYLAGKGVSRETLNKMQTLLKELLNLLPQKINKYLNKEEVKKNPPQPFFKEEKEIMQKNFFSISQEEKAQFDKVVSVLMKKLKQKFALRKKKQKPGKLHLQKIIRENISLESVPFNLIFHKRKKEKLKLFIVCDISDSVRYAARFILSFVYFTQKYFNRCRSFVFVSNLKECTAVFKNKNLSSALEVIFSNKIIPLYTYTDYGSALLDFEKIAAKNLSKKSVIIFLGDGRTNYTHPHSEILKKISKKTRKIFWLNPEPKYNWNTGDSVMNLYSPNCSTVEEVRTPQQLYNVLLKI